MPDASASVRAYHKLKSDILSGRLPVGALDTRLLGDRLRMSATPVREALARLGAERLVRQTPYHGYAVAAPSARRIEDLYQLSGSLMNLCLARRMPGRASSADEGPDMGCYATNLTALLCEIASAQPNNALMETLVALGDQLFPARRCETRLFPDASHELAALRSCWTSRSIGDLRLRLRDHHRMRAIRADAVARLILEDSGGA